ncbi:unnamed protein product, partial [Didymodactylos carnosus]
TTLPSDNAESISLSSIITTSSNISTNLASPTETQHCKYIKMTIDEWYDKNKQSLSLDNSKLDEPDNYKLVIPNINGTLDASITCQYGSLIKLFRNRTYFQLSNFYNHLKSDKCTIIKSKQQQKLSDDNNNNNQNDTNDNEQQQQSPATNTNDKQNDDTITSDEQENNNDNDSDTEIKCHSLSTVHDDVLLYSNEKFYNLVNETAGENVLSILKIQLIHSVQSLLRTNNVLELFNYGCSDLIEIKKKSCFMLSDGAYIIKCGIINGLNYLTNILKLKDEQRAKLNESLSSSNELIIKHPLLKALISYYKTSTISLNKHQEGFLTTLINNITSN